jgi:hypothetical protein
MIGLWVGLLVGFIAEVVVGALVGVVVGLVFGLTGGLTAGITVGFGRAVMRYVAFLVCTRRWSRHPLPWRLGAFLHWCSQVGLMRIAGIAYQFRHRELQDYLARHPDPEPPA